MNGAQRQTVAERTRDPAGLTGRRVVALLPRAYRLLVSPWLPPACRYEPTCSRYAEEALLRHGAVRGIWLAFRRVARCHPFGGSGYDPVP